MSIGAYEALFRLGPAILLGGMVSLFACSRILAGMLPREGTWIGGRAVCHFIPIAAASVVAMMMGRTEIAIGIVFGTSVGALTTVVGFVAMSGPVGAGPSRWRRVWPFQLAAALLVFVTGFKGTLNWMDAVALLTEGLLLLTLWNDPGGETTTQAVLEEAAGGARGGTTLDYASTDAGAGGTGQVVVLALELLMLAALLWLGSWCVTQGTVRTSRLLKHMAPSGLASTVVALSLVMPMMYGTWRQSAGERGWAPVTTQVGVVMLNLCALLPVMILLPYAAAYVPALNHWAGDALAWHEGLPRPLLYPSPMWRIDNVVLIIVGVLLLPVGLGKWTLSREEGMALMAGYFFYLTTTVASSFAPGHR